MANTQVTSSLEVIKFRRDFFREYVRLNRLSAFTGTEVTNPIVIKEDRGPTIRHPLVTRLKGSGVSGSNTLRGNGESIGNYSWDTNPTYYRHAVEFDKEEMEQTNIALMRAARPLLMEWAKSATRDRMIRALGAVYNGTTYAEQDGSGYTAGIANTWQANNTDRIIYGANITQTGVHLTDLGGIGGTTDAFKKERVSDMRSLAETADPHIRPIETDQDSEVYVIFAGPESFEDLKTDLESINSNADVRGMKITRGGNVIARDGDLFYNGCIIRKVPEIKTIFTASGKLLATAGALSAAVEPAFLCGAQALVWGLGQRPNIIVDNDYDYNFQPGVAVELKEDIKKAFFNDVQHGTVTGYFTGV